MFNGETIPEPQMFCPECRLPMTATFHVKPGNSMDIAEAVCPKGHKVVLRVDKNVPDKNIIERLAYLVKYDGGEVIYEDE